VKHVLTQNFLQKPEIYQNRPDKQVSLTSQQASGSKYSPPGQRPMHPAFMQQSYQLNVQG